MNVVAIGPFETLSDLSLTYERMPSWIQDNGCLMWENMWKTFHRPQSRAGSVEVRTENENGDLLAV